MSCRKRVQRALEGAVRLPLRANSRYVLFSDCHRGEGTNNDNFLKNQHLYLAAAEHYLRTGFFYIELGDGEELWENRCLRRIMSYHERTYRLLDCYQRQNRFLKIYGNHDMELKGELPPAVILKNGEGGRDICMIHGHQADFFNSVCWRLSRFLVRYLWKPIELSGINDPTSAARNYRKTERYENCLRNWTVENDCYLVAGHSHRPRLPEEGEGYMNTGSCVHPSGVTCIEIEQMRATLVRWSMGTDPNAACRGCPGSMALYVNREVIAGPMELH